MGRYERFSIGKRYFAGNPENPNKWGWQELDLSDVKINKPTVFCLGGNASLTSREANGMCKLAQRLMGVKGPTGAGEIGTSNDVDFLGISYGKSSPNNSVTSSLTDMERLDIIQSIFRPFYLSDDGTALSREQMLKNFNRVTFFAHCHGATEVRKISLGIFEDMKNLGINEKDANDAVDQMFAVAYAPEFQCAIPTLQVWSIKDKNVFDSPGPDFGKVTNDFYSAQWQQKSGDGTVAFRGSDYSISVITTEIAKSNSDEHPISVISRDDDWKIEAKDPTYGDEVSMVMGNALALSVANSIQNENSAEFTPTPTLDEILEETNSILAGTKNQSFYEAIERIKSDSNGSEME